MRAIADLHVHSKYARATSRDNGIEGLAAGAKIKGIGIMATGDFTHPQYFNEIRSLLAPAEDGSGLYAHGGVRFILSTEISLIYGAGNRTRNTEHGAQNTGHGALRMHHIALSPSLEIASQINDRLSKKGNLASDGRPILGLSSPEFADILFGISPEIMIIPAHAWTPWFSIFGSMSGVDSVEEAFGDKSDRIFALETGLSSDPAMNWTVSRLDKYALVSNSDAHSLDKLGREANVFDLPDPPTYAAVRDAIRTRKGFVKTYEFYPEEGKYHYDGHRDCGVLWSPAETKAHNGICPVCRKPVTVGVMHRVADLADRRFGEKPEGAVPFQHIVPLKTIIAKALGKKEIAVAVKEEYSRLVRALGNEFAVFEADDSKVRAATTTEIANAIAKVREGKVSWKPGYDGVFGELILDESRAPQRGAAVVSKKQSSLADF